MSSKSALRSPLALLLAVLVAVSLSSRPALGEESAAPTATPPASSVGNNYIIGPGDTIQVFVWRNPDLSVTVPVRPDGKISTPLAEDIVAIGKTPTQLARDMETVLAEFVRSPQVNVIVSHAVSSFSQVTVVGQVHSPQAMPYREGLRVLDVVLAAGGLTDFAAPNRAKVVRKVDGREQTLNLHLGDLLNHGRMDQNFELRPGDVVIVPQARF